MVEKGIKMMNDYTGLRRKKILLAEDVKLNQYIAQRILESWGCIVTIANNGKEAFELMQQGFFDCILMDVQMPELDGISATELIRKLPDEYKSSIPIIALTANALASDKEKYSKAGMNDCIAKPINEEKLFSIITKNIPAESFLSSKNIPAEKNNEQMNESEKLYDLGMVISVSGGNRDFIKKMVLLFMETVPPNVAELKKSTESENWDHVVKIAHKLKSTIDSMGIKSISPDIRTIESDAKQKINLTEIPSLVNKVESVIDNCIVQLQTELQ